MAKINYSLKEMLESLDIPMEDQYQDVKDMSSDKFVSSVDLFVTEKAVRKLWIKWNPDAAKRSEDPTFLTAFREMLAEAASLGFRLNRFKEISKELPEPTESRRSWIPLFEKAIQKCHIRFYLNKDDYQKWLGSGSNDKEGEQSFKQRVEMMTDGLFNELGLIFPLINFSIDEALVAPYFRVEWNDFLLPPQKGVPEDKILVHDTVDRLTLLNIKGEEAINPANGSECAFISSEYRETVETAGLTTWDSAECLLLTLSTKIRRNAAAFVNRPIVELLLNQLDQTSPETVKQVNEKFDKALLVQIIRRVLAEEIPIRNLSNILNLLLSLQIPIHLDFSRFIVFAISGGIIISRHNNLDEAKVNDYVEMVRNSMKRYISHKYTQTGNTLVVYLMAHEAESRLAQSQKLSNKEREELINCIRQEVGELSPTTQNPVILTTMEIRHHLRMVIRSEIPYLAVLSYQELSPDLDIRPIARISPELFPFNESFYRLFELLPEFSIADSMKTTFQMATLSKQDKPLFEFLDKHRKDILSMVKSRIIKKHAKQKISENDLQKLLVRFLDTYFELLFSEQTKLTDELLKNLTQASTTDEVKISDISEIPLIINTVMRSLLSEEYTNMDGQESIQSFKKVLERIELIAHNVASKFLKTSFHAKYYNLIH